MEKIYINGGGRGFLIEISARSLEEVLEIKKVEVAVKDWQSLLI